MIRLLLAGFINVVAKRAVAQRQERSRQNDK